MNEWVSASISDSCAFSRNFSFHLFFSMCFILLYFMLLLVFRRLFGGRGCGKEQGGCRGMENYNQYIFYEEKFQLKKKSQCSRWFIIVILRCSISWCIVFVFPFVKTLFEGFITLWKLLLWLIIETTPL